MSGGSGQKDPAPTCIYSGEGDKVSTELLYSGEGGQG